MTDSIQIFPTLWQFSDSNGDPVAGGTIEAYVAGSSTPLTVYSDSGLTTTIGTTVYCDSAGYVVASSGSSTKINVYTGTAAYKLVFKTSAGATVGTLDNIKGAIDTSGFTTTSARPVGNVVSVADTEWAVAISDGTGTLYNANVFGGSQVVSFPSAVTAGNGYMFGIRHDGAGSANTVTYQTSAGELIKANGAASGAAGVLTGYGETGWFISDSVGWTRCTYVPPLIDAGVIKITDRTTTAPSSPPAGARYLLNGTPTGTWLTAGYQQHDIVEHNGIGGYILHRPVEDCGWIAYVADENLHTAFVGTAWTDWSNITAPTATTLRQMVVSQQVAAGTNGGVGTAAAWTIRPGLGVETNTITTANGAVSDASLATNVITLPTGTYDVDFWQTFKGTSSYTGRFISTTDSAKVISATNDNPGASSQVISRGRGRISVTAATESFRVDYYMAATLSATDLGLAINIAGRQELYCKIVITDVQAVQGPQGSAGATGAAGRDAGIGRWAFNTTTTSGTSSGQVRFNSGTFASITTIYLNETDADSRALSTTLDTLDDSSSSVKGILSFVKQDTPGTFCHFEVTAMSDTGTERVLTVTPRSGSVPANADSMAVAFFRAGDAGSGGGGSGVAVSAAGGGITSGTASFVNANGVSFSVNGQSISASVATGNFAGTGFTSATTAGTAIVATQNTAGLSMGVPNYLTSQSNQALSGSNGSYTFQTATFGNLNGLSFYTSNGSMVGSYTVPTQSAQTIGAYAVSNTTGAGSSTTVDARSLSFQGAGVASVGMSNGSVIISVPSGGGGGDGGVGIAAGGVTQSANTVVFSNANGVSFGLNASTMTASHNGLTTAAQSDHSHGVTLALTNLSGTTGGNSNGITISLSAAAGGGGADGYNILAAGSQTAGTAATVNFANSNGITFGMSASSQITASHNGLTTARASTDAIGLNSAVSNVTATINSSGLSLDARGYAGTATTFAGTNVSASVTLNSAGLNMALSAPDPGTGGGGGVTLSYFDNVAFPGNATASPVAGRMSLQPVVIPQALSASYARFMMSMVTASTTFATTANTAFSGSVMSTFYFGVWSRMTGASSQSLSLLASSSAGMTQRMSLSADAANGSNFTVSYDATIPTTGGTTSISSSSAYSNATFQVVNAISASMSSGRFIDIGFATSLSAGQYVIGFGIGSSAATQGTADLTAARVSGSVMAYSGLNIDFQPFGAATNASYHQRPGLGTYGAVTMGDMALSAISRNAIFPVMQIMRVT